jgi:hypothetical protein
MRCSVTLIAETSQADADPAALAALRDHFTAVMDALADLEAADQRLSNADMSVCLAQHTAMFSVEVEEQSLAAAVDVAQTVMRSAIHGAGGFTPGWEKHRWTIDLAGEVDDLLVDA